MLANKHLQAHRPDHSSTRARLVLVAGAALVCGGDVEKRGRPGAPSPLRRIRNVLLVIEMALKHKINILPTLRKVGSPRNRGGWKGLKKVISRSCRDTGNQIN
jgi:hypothetical protein